MNPNILVFISMSAGTMIMIVMINRFISSRLKNRLPSDASTLSSELLKVVLFIVAAFFLSELTLSVQALTRTLSTQFTGKALIVKELSYFSFFLFITLLMVFLSACFAFFTFKLLSKGKNIFSEVANNNKSSLAIFSGALFAYAIVLRYCLPPFLEEFIPYSVSPVYH